MGRAEGAPRFEGPRPRGGHPRHRLQHVMVEQRRHRIGQRRVPCPPVECTQRMAHRTQPQRRAAPLVRHRKTVPAQRDLLPVDAQQCRAAGTEDKDRAIAATMRAQMRDLRIARQHDPSDAEVGRLQRGADSRPANARNPHADADRRSLRRRQPGGCLRDHIGQHRPQRIDSDPGIGCARLPGADLPPGGVDQPRPAIAAAGIDAQKEAHASHARALGVCPIPGFSWLRGSSRR